MIAGYYRETCKEEHKSKQEPLGVQNQMQTGSQQHIDLH